MTIRAVRPPISAMKIMLISFLCIAVGHLAMKTLIPSLAVNAAGVGLVVVILGWVLFQKKDLFSFLLIIFVCSQFNIANNQGGLFNLAAFFLLVIYLAQNKIRETGARTDIVIGIALIVLFVSNSLGVLFRSPVPYFIKALEFSAFTGILLAFYAASKLRLTEARMRVLVLVLSFTMLWNLFVSLNQYYLFVAIKTPFLGLYSDFLYRTTNSFGTFGSSSSNGQFAMMMLAFLLPMICATVTRDKLRINALFLIGVVLACCLIIVLANMRAAALEAVMIILIYLVMFSIFYRRSFKYSKYLTRFAIFLVIFLVFFGAWVGLQEIAADFQTVQVESKEDVLSGESLNRLGPWQYGYELLVRNNWWLGYGHGVQESNQLAWGGKRISSGEILGGGHLHNLYLALPMLYGWFGATAYVFMFCTITLRLFRTVRKFSYNNYTVVVMLGFLVSSALFLVDEIKSGNAVQNINHPMLIFIWFGLGLAAVRTVRFDLAMAKINRLEQEDMTEYSKTSEYIPQS